MTKTLSTVAAAAILLVAGCHDTDDHGQATGRNVTPDYTGSHYNPVVNSDGSGVGRDDPAIKPSAGDATGRVNAGAIGESSSGTNVGGGSSNQNSGSGVGSGGTGSSSGR